MRALLAAALILAPALALAQRSLPPNERKLEVIFTTDDLIQGTGQSPFIGNVDVLRPPKFSNLIKLRKDFNDKIRSEQLQ